MALASPGSLHAQQVCAVAGTMASGNLRVVVDGDTMVALTRAEYAELTRRMIMLENALAVIDRLEGVRESTEAYMATVDRQSAISDSLIAAQRAQIADYEQLATLLEKVANRGRRLSADFGVGSLGGTLTGMAGLGFGRFRALGLAQKDDLGFLLGGSIPIW